MTEQSLASADEVEGRQDTVRKRMKVSCRSWGGTRVSRVGVWSGVWVGGGGKVSWYHS